MNLHAQPQPLHHRLHSASSSRSALTQLIQQTLNLFTPTHSITRAQHPPSAPIENKNVEGVVNHSVSASPSASRSLAIGEDDEEDEKVTELESYIIDLQSQLSNVQTTLTLLSNRTPVNDEAVLRSCTDQLNVTQHQVRQLHQERSNQDSRLTETIQRQGAQLVALVDEMKFLQQRFDEVSRTPPRDDILSPGGTGSSSLTAEVDSPRRDFLRLQDHQSAPSSEVAIPVGAVLVFVGLNAPYGYLICDGQLFDHNRFRVLASVIGTSYNLPSDPDNVHRLPDMRNRFPRGCQNTLDLGRTGGVTEVQLEEKQIPTHIHRVTGTTVSVNSCLPSHRAVNPNNQGEAIVRYAGSSNHYPGWFSGAYTDYAVAPPLPDHTHNFDVVSQPCGGGEPFNILPPHILVQFIIKY